MPLLQRLDIKGVRNLKPTSWACNPRINLIYGENGSGKTSLLEAINLLALGRSFRSHKTKTLINFNESSLTVFSKCETYDNHSASIGIQKTRDGASSIKCNGDLVSSIADIAKLLPVKVIDANAFQLIEGSPTQRRSFLDWLVFHVKPEFSLLWRHAQKSIKQRNSLLRRDKIDRSQLVVWDKQLSTIAVQMHELRQEVFDLFLEKISQHAGELYNSLGDADIRYLPGWDVSRPYESTLEEDWLRDSRDGYTHRGPHRSDLRFLFDGKPASELLSRGQEKAFIVLMHIAQAHCFTLKRQSKCIFLVDDMPSELDGHFQRQLANRLLSLGGQVFVTGIGKQEVQSAWVDQDNIEKDWVSVFHVEHGALNQAHSELTTKDQL